MFFAPCNFFKDHAIAHSARSPEKLLQRAGAAFYAFDSPCGHAGCGWVCRREERSLLIPAGSVRPLYALRYRNLSRGKPRGSETGQAQLAETVQDAGQDRREVDGLDEGGGVQSVQNRLEDAQSGKPEVELLLGIVVHVE